MAATADPSVTSPKVKAGAWAGLAVTLLGSIIAAIVTFGMGITPESFDGMGLGIWAIPVATLVNTLVTQLAAWWKSDPLRANYVAQYNARAAQTQAEIDARFMGNAG